MMYIEVKLRARHYVRIVNDLWIGVIVINMDEAKIGIINILQRLPLKDENEIAGMVEDLVNKGLLSRSSPPATTNHAVNSALFTINKWLKKVESS